MTAMDVDPVISLAASMHSAPRTFALLLGSGISRSAQVATGWDVVVDLIRKVAVLTDGESPEDPVACYREREATPTTRICSSSSRQHPQHGDSFP